MISEMLKNKNEKKCPFCGETVNEADFTDELSKREFHISGLCQRCQDDFFD